MATITFDDLIPQQNPASGIVSFDDLIPQVPPEDVRDPATGIPGGAPTAHATDQGVNRGYDAPTYIAQRADRGVADFLGLPVDLTTLAVNAGLWGADKLAGLFDGHVDARVRNPVGGSDWIADQASKAYEGAGGRVVPEEAVSPLVRTAGAASRFGTGAALSGGTLAAVPAQELAQTSSLAGRLVRPLAAPYKESAAPLIGDAVAGAGSGAADQAYQEHAPDAVKNRLGGFGDVIASLLGGVTGATASSLARGGLHAAGTTARDIVTGKGDSHAPMRLDGSHPYTRGEMDLAARNVQAQASNPAVAAREIADRTAQMRQFAGPGEVPTTGAMSNDVGLTQLEREARSRFPRPFNERDRAVGNRAGEILHSVAPKDSTPKDFTTSANAIDRANVNAAARDLSQAQRAEAGADAAARAEGQRVAANAGQSVPASQNLDREIVEHSLRPMQERKNAAFQAIDPERTVVRDAAPLIEAAQGIRDTLGRLNDPGSILPTRTLDRIEALAGGTKTEAVPTGLVDEAGSPITREVTRAAGGDGTITFGEINALRPELSAALIKARNAGDFALADNLQRLQAAINAETDRLASEATPAGQRAATAKQIYGEEFAPVWNTGPGDEAKRFRQGFNADRQGRTLTPPSATAGRFLQRGTPEKAESLRRIIESMPDGQTARDEARRFIVSDLADSGVVDASTGKLRLDALRRWRQQWGPVLDTVPGLAQEVDGMIRSTGNHAAASNRLAKDVRAAEAGLDDAVKNKGALGLVIGKDPINAVSSVFNSNDPEKAMGDIVRQIGGDGRAKAGLKSAVADYLAHKATTPALEETSNGSRPVSFDHLENIFNRHEKTLAKVYSPSEMNTLRQAHKLLQPQRALSGTGKPGALYDTHRTDQAWRLLEGGLKAKFGILKGGGILRTIKIFVQSLPNSGDAVSEIVSRMFFDPELAGHLLTRKVNPESPAWNAKLNRLLSIATGAGADQ